VRQGDTYWEGGGRSEREENEKKSEVSPNFFIKVDGRYG
jgi:hypothetical protein